MIEKVCVVVVRSHVETVDIIPRKHKNKNEEGGRELFVVTPTRSMP